MSHHLSDSLSIQNLTFFDRGRRASDMRFVLPSALILTLPVTSIIILIYEYTMQEISPIVSMDSEDDADMVDRLSLSSLISIFMSPSDSVSIFFGILGVSISDAPILKLNSLALRGRLVGVCS